MSTVFKESSKDSAKKSNKTFLSSAENIGFGSLFVSQPQKTTSWTITISFHSKEKAMDFIEDRNLLKEPKVIQSFKRAAAESKQKKARPIEELYKKYGV